MFRSVRWSWKPVFYIGGAILAVGMYQQHASGTGVFRQDGPLRLASDLASYYLRKATAAVDTNSFNNDAAAEAASLNQIPAQGDLPSAAQQPATPSGGQFSSSPFTCGARHDFGCPPCYGPQSYGW